MDVQVEFDRRRKKRNILQWSGLGLIIVSFITKRVVPLSEQVVGVLDIAMIVGMVVILAAIPVFKCPKCNNLLKWKATKCVQCGSDFSGNSNDS